MKMLEHVIVVKKDLKINKKTKNSVTDRKVRDHCLYIGEYRVPAQSRCNLKYSVYRKSSTVFHNGSSCDYYVIIKEEEFET